MKKRAFCPLSGVHLTIKPYFYREAEPHDGLFIDKEDEPVKDLAWPEGIVGMMLCHLNWADGFSYTLYTLLPVRSKRSVKDIQMVEKNRSAGWQKGAIYK